MKYSGDRKKAKKKFLIAVLALIFSVALYFFVDLIDLPSRLGITIAKINTDFLGTIVGVFVALLIFCLTYHFIDQWNVNRQNNQREIAILLLRDSYSECMKDLDFLYAEALKYLVKRTDFDKLYNQDSPAARYSSMAFSHDDMIMQFAADGIINKTDLEHYLSAKNNWIKHVSLSVTFFDNLALVQPTKNQIKSELEQAIRSLPNESVAKK